jgi:folylpolyglutamate synthase
VEKLNSTQSGFKALAEKRGAGQKIDDRVVEQMREWLRRVGHHVSEPLPVYYYFRAISQELSRH